MGACVITCKARVGVSLTISLSGIPRYHSIFSQAIDSKGERGGRDVHTKIEKKEKQN
jgi:hypothetical protein